MAFDPRITDPPQPVEGDPMGTRPNPAIARAARLRQFLQQNPGRAGAPMGRNPDGSIAYDPSQGGGDQSLPDRLRQRIGPRRLGGP